MTKIFVERALANGDEIELGDFNLKHLRVIKTVPGDTILIGDINSKEFKASVTEISSRKCRIKIEQENSNIPSPERHITMYICLPKKNKLEDIVYKCSQIGVSRFVPVVSSRTEKKIKDPEKLYIRMLKKARSGAELSKRERIPEIGRLLSFRQSIDDYRSGSYESGIIFWEEEKENYISLDELTSGIAVFIGPEGGFSRHEIDIAKEAGLNVKSLGRLVMDVETASAAASAVLLCPVK